jgi:hypothetical protein
MAMHDNGRVPSIRVGDVERDAAAAELGDHYAAGRLTIDELHDRLGLVLSARTRADLTHVLADLPTIRRPARPPAAASPPPREEPADHAGRLAAVALLMVAILIWLFTVALFTRHGYYYPHYPQGGYGGYFPGHPPHSQWFTP